MVTINPKYVRRLTLYQLTLRYKADYPYWLTRESGRQTDNPCMEATAFYPYSK
ncbi:MAG: hypothetical protein Sw1PiTSA_20980 [Shewanella algae]|uniref:Uncharacterized protein n=1 Tax=Shewanella algae TaxID=38313 RepID=A0AAD1K737_9GAMM|nr:hypothetical protein TUM17378_09890 [Shewanella algae]GHB18846.1 hypothetical protein GCM10007107_34740 [Shewanella indica]BCV43974.1 hypothetical protein TUM17379_09920 [Shewanella algae]BCV48305.1 hypothetical protein TUM17382_09980 [Shewanella algae]BCV57041.1 hypothetical protein TUM17384_09860 [Shewanella algae]